MRTGRPSSRRDSARHLRRAHCLGLDQHRDNGTRVQRKRAVAQNAQDRANLARVRSKAHPGRAIIREDVVEQLLGSERFCLTRLGGHPGPERIILGEASFNVPRRKQIVNVRLVVAAVASVLGDTFPQLFLDGGQEGVLRRQRKAGEGQIGRGEAPREWGHVVALRSANLLGFNAR